MFKKYIFIYLLIVQLFSNNFIPLNNVAINYTQVFFRWPQIENAEYYILNIENSISENFEITSTFPVHSKNWSILFGK